MPLKLKFVASCYFSFAVKIVSTKSFSVLSPHCRSVSECTSVILQVMQTGHPVHFLGRTQFYDHHHQRSIFRFKPVQAPRFVLYISSLVYQLIFLPRIRHPYVCQDKYWCLFVSYVRTIALFVDWTCQLSHEFQIISHIHSFLCRPDNRQQIS